MITEDYVSFETAKLMHDKGFNLADFHGQWAIDFDNVPNTEEEDPEGKIIVAEWQYPLITFQMAMKWLRDVHKLVIEPYRTACGYLYTISNIPYGSTKYDNSQAFNGDDEDSGQWSTWEKACEDGIKYCLENLI